MIVYLATQACIVALHSALFSYNGRLCSEELVIVIHYCLVPCLVQCAHAIRSYSTCMCECVGTPVPMEYGWYVMGTVMELPDPMFEVATNTCRIRNS